MLTNAPASHARMAEIVTINKTDTPAIVTPDGMGSTARLILMNVRVTLAKMVPDAWIY